ncbi:TPA: hypothetical protein ACGXEV_000593 [Pseudomonas aeruginosa]
MNKANECTCPSGDGSLVHPCPAHPAVEQAGGDERAACNLWIAEQQLCQGSDISLFKLERNGALVSLRDLLRDAYQAGQARAALAQPSPVRSSLLINGYQLRAALDFIAPDGTAEQLESETCIEWRQQDADFLEAGLYAFCAEYPEEGGVLLDEEPTTAQPSPLQSEQAEAERPEVVAYRTIGRHEKHQHPHYALNYYKQNAEDQATHWRERGCEVSEDELMTVAQHERIVGALRAKAAQLREALEWRAENQAGQRELLRSVTAERDAALARVEQQERTIAGINEAHAKLAGLYEAAQAQHSAGYAEARQCVNCRHIGINDAADYAACHDCRWTGPEPDEDKCPGCAGENCMAAACPECGGRYELVAEAKISTPAAQAGQMPQAWLDVQAERRRQITAEGWTPEHDDEHDNGEMARAAACYALAGSSAPNDGTAALLVSLAWPWDQQWWKPTSARRDLVKACALALAEIERLDRACISQSPQPGATTASS